MGTFVMPSSCTQPTPPHPTTLRHTDIMIKPDGVQRGLIGEIIARFERKGFK